MIRRLGLLGLVDARGNPNPELKSALNRLTQMGLSIANDNRERDTLPVSSSTSWSLRCGEGPGFGGGWYLRPFPEGRPAWSACFCESVIPERGYPFDPAPREYHAAFVERPEEDVVKAFQESNEAYARAYVRRKGLDDADAFVEASRDCGMGATRYPAYFTDCKQAETSYKYGWCYHEIGSGSFRARRAIVFPKLGIILSECNAYAEALPDGIPDM
ncbi:MAG: hypothetical protein DUD39_04150 [Coriobacteriaceae bacterium]|nr:MAG: hypothetical protein DUD39_04150 [Coriobacteriaceae bacterium]